jgi:hypothetical protein
MFRRLLPPQEKRILLVSMLDLTCSEPIPAIRETDSLLAFVRRAAVVSDDDWRNPLQPHHAYPILPLHPRGGAQVNGSKRFEHTARTKKKRRRLLQQSLRVKRPPQDVKVALSLRRKFKNSLVFKQDHSAARLQTCRNGRPAVFKPSQPGIDCSTEDMLLRPLKCRPPGN